MRQPWHDALTLADIEAETNVCAEACKTGHMLFGVIIRIKME